MTKTKSTFLALLAVLLSPMAVNADLIEVTGTASSDGTWEITLIETIFGDSQALLESQEWYNDRTLAKVFALALGIVPGISQFGQDIGPLFLWDSFHREVGGAYAAYGDPVGDLLPFGLYSWCCAGGNGDTNTHTFATATRVPEPGTLALFGIGLAGMGLVRRRRKG